MPNWKTHILITFVIYALLVITFKFSPPTSIAALILLAFASILPDFDHPKSVIREALSIIMGFFSFAIFMSFFDFDLPIRLISGAITGGLVYFGLKKFPLSHRGPDSLHQWKVCFLFVGLCTLVFLIAGISFQFLSFLLLGYGVHLLVDKNV